MRISDWSSDVCSSDLRRHVAGRHQRHHRPAAAHRRPRHHQDRHRARYDGGVQPGPDHHGDGPGYGDRGRRAGRHQGQPEGPGSLSRRGTRMSETATMVPGAARTAGEAYFSVRDLHAYYGESYIVQGVSFEIAENELVDLLGRKGDGKTSTLRALARTDQTALGKG